MPDSLTLTDREHSILRFCISRFINDAYSRANAAAQDKDQKYFTADAVSKFYEDIKDAEELLKKLSVLEFISLEKSNA